MSFFKNYPNEAIGVLRKKTYTCYKTIEPNKFTTEQLFLHLVDQSEGFFLVFSGDFTGRRYMLDIWRDMLLLNHFDLGNNVSKNHPDL